FNRLTGARVEISNYPGSTVEYTKGRSRLLGESVELIDVPGTYSLKPSCRAEEVAVEMLDKESIIINVVDATNLERNLYLTLELIERGFAILVALNIWDETKHRGINIDVKKLENILGVPVVPTCGLSGEGIRELVLRLKTVKEREPADTSSTQRWERIGRIVSEVQVLSHRHHTFLEILEGLSIRPLSGILIGLIVLSLSFFIIRIIGESLISYILDPLFEKYWLPVMEKLSAVLQNSEFIHHLVIGNLIEGKIDFGLSFGVLTTGLYVPLAVVFPYILSFYFVLGLMEDFGYLPRFAVLVDNIMHKVGLHGYAAIGMVLGLGCNVPGALSTRLLESRREKFIAATLLSIAVPCMAQIAVIVGLLGSRSMQAVIVVFVTLALIWFAIGLVLNKVVKGESMPLMLEIPPYRKPQIKSVLKKLFMRISGFLTEAVPYVLLGVLLVSIFYTIGIIDILSRLFSPVLKHAWGLPPEAISALLIGFLRKDVAVGMLGPMDLTLKQLTVGCIILAIYFPCFATFMVLVKELGLKDMLKSALIMVLTTLLVGGILSRILWL
ncbi:MAG: ferrous iron transporter B, partial [Candidatus Omnitrophica bacterium]|nr:ferrous iron transporter B [Candidatus Omnitrophota bacterium]